MCVCVRAWLRVDPPAEALGRRGPAPRLVGGGPWRGLLPVAVEALGVADVLQERGPQVGQAAVLRQHQSGPRVSLRHVQRRDSHGSAHLRERERERERHTRTRTHTHTNTDPIVTQAFSNGCGTTKCKAAGTLVREM